LDKISKEKRSKIMASIRSKNTKPEIVFRNALSSKQLTFETNCGSEKIDIAFPSEKIAIFVDGCFWHGCPIHGHIPTTHPEYWAPKLRRNIERDKSQNERLRNKGWLVLRFWEHELGNIDKVLEETQKALKKRKP
jgi:DNA mismatch endonuclease (patch repair protein)